MAKSAKAKALENFVAAIVATTIEEFVTMQCMACNDRLPHPPEYIAVIIFFFVGAVTAVRWAMGRIKRNDHPPAEPGRAG